MRNRQVLLVGSIRDAWKPFWRAVQAETNRQRVDTLDDMEIVFGVLAESFRAIAPKIIRSAPSCAASAYPTGGEARSVAGSRSSNSEDATDDHSTRIGPHLAHPAIRNRQPANECQPARPADRLGPPGPRRADKLDHRPGRGRHGGRPRHWVSSDHEDLPQPVFVHDFTGGRSGHVDRNGHSTHCAGIIGARANDIGVAGVAPKCRIGYCKVLGDSGSGSSSGIERGVRKAIDDGANIISMSLGGGYDEGTARAIAEANEQGVLVVAAAGNSGYRGGNTIDYPGRLQETLCVAAYNERGRSAPSAAAVRRSTSPAQGRRFSAAPGNRYVAMSGTSMATPFFAGLLALMLSAHTDGDVQLRSADAVRELIRQHAEDRGQLGKDVRWGWGTPLLGGLLDEVVGEEERCYWL